MKVLITGDTGYIGSTIVPLFLQQNFDVVGLDSDLFEQCVFEVPNYKIPHIRKDLREVTVDDLRGFDAIVHLGALSNDPLGNLDPNLTYDINHKASVHLAELAREAGVSRFLFSSSCSIYGAAGQDAVNESAPFNPVTPYGHSKELVEASVRELATEAFSPVFLRNATVYGWSPRMRFDLVLNNLTAHAIATGKILIKSDGTPWRPIVHVEDVGRAFIAAINAPRERVHNQAYNIGQTSENYQIRDIADIVKDVVPGTEVTYAPGGEPDKRSYRVDFGKVQRELPEWQPQWNARKGAEQLRDAYQRVGVTLEDFEGPRFRRIDLLKRLMSEGKVDKTLRWAEVAAV
jgi:nucleoside-diphosphate-sugar epimerase